MATTPPDIDPALLASFRLECIKLAASQNADAASTVTDAGVLYDFVANGPPEPAP